MKLYPPSIEGKLPAFTGTILKVPFNINKAVNPNEIFGMLVIIKTAQNGIIIGGKSIDGSMYRDENTNQYYALFELSQEVQSELILGFYYKIQIACKDSNNTVGYFSSVGIIKYTSMPQISIPQLIDNFNSTYEYTGIYSQEDTVVDGKVTIKRDQTEKVYSYCFELTDRLGNIITTSGIQLHNSERDTELYSSTDKWINKIDLPIDEPYFLTYKITTINGLEASTPKYKVINQDSIDIEIPIVLLATMNYDDGCIELELETLDSNSNVIINHNIVVSRASSLNNFTTWEEIYRSHYSKVNFLNNKKILIWEDYSIQQGVEYKYAIQCFNEVSNIYSNRMYNVDNKYDKNPIKIFADFEDSFLADGERQLKIRFNPKVSSFKNTVLEQKMDTIGGKYPFIFRNGNVGYKEFPISGLISMLCDPNEKFMKGIQSQDLFSNRPSTPSFKNPNGSDTNLSTNNIKREREFKMEVLAWLNNGKPKIFRSPTEGNYIVRLMNISLSPNDTLGRMLHTFSSTAYEVSDYNLSNLIDMGLIKVPAQTSMNAKVGQIKCSDVAAAIKNGTLTQQYPHLMGDSKQTGQIIGFDSNINANRVIISDATPGTRFSIMFRDRSKQEIHIGGTGTYQFLIDEPHIQNITCLDAWDNTKITFTYYFDRATDSFNYIQKITLKDEACQFIGPGFTGFNKNSKYNLINELSNVKRQLGTFIYIKINKRQIVKIWGNGGTNPNGYYLNEAKTKLLMDDLQRHPLYYAMDTGKYYSWNGNQLQTLLNNVPDYRFALNPKDSRDFIDFEGRSQNINGESIGDSFGRIDALRNVNDVEELYVGTGLIVDLIYRVREKTYTIETEGGYNKLISLKTSLNSAQQELDNYIYTVGKQTELETKIQKVKTAYKNYVKQLQDDLDKINQGVQIV